MALAGPIPDNEEAISSAEALLTLTGEAETIKLARDKSITAKIEVKFLIILIFSKGLNKHKKFTLKNINLKKE
ncbi:hypothetical protein JCM30760_06020 [Thiomicrorhabdus hydrogeniphila]